MIGRLKAHLVAKGYAQTYDIDYFEIVYPVAKLNSVWKGLYANLCNLQENHIFMLWWEFLNISKEILDRVYYSRIMVISRLKDIRMQTRLVLI